MSTIDIIDNSLEISEIFHCAQVLHLSGAFPYLGSFRIFSGTHLGKKGTNRTHKILTTHNSMLYFPENIINHSKFQQKKISKQVFMYSKLRSLEM